SRGIQNPKHGYKSARARRWWRRQHGTREDGNSFTGRRHCHVIFLLQINCSGSSQRESEIRPATCSGDRFVVETEGRRFLPLALPFSPIFGRTYRLRYPVQAVLKQEVHCLPRRE